MAATKSIDDYIAGFPAATQKVLGELRALVRATAPGATERISYGIPVFDLNGHYLVYIAGWKKHVSVYPVTAGVEAALGDELGRYRTGKGTLRFPLAEPLPEDLIRRVVAARVAEVAAAPPKKRRAKRAEK